MTYRNFKFTPDLELIASLIDAEPFAQGYELSLRRIAKDFKHTQGLINGSRLRAELPNLRSLDIDFYYHPGNEHVAGHGAIDLDFIKQTAQLKYHGDWEWFREILERWVTNLRLKPTEYSQESVLLNKIKSSISAELWGHIEPILRAANYSAALTAAVVFTEDCLRKRLGPPARDLAGADLCIYAFRTPGIFTPPLAGATNAEENAFLLLKGWFGLVRNLHGHQASVEMTDAEVFAQLNGCNYVLWIITNSTERT